MNSYKRIFGAALITGCALLGGAGIALAQSTVTLTAASQTTLMPDGQTVPMWGWQCGTATAAPAVNATCTAANGAAQTGTTWQPPLITIATGNTLSITLNNKLPAPVNTSLVIVGQVSGADPNGLGNPTREPATGVGQRAPHVPQTLTTWQGVATAASAFTPPAQGPRARSFTKEAITGGSVTYTWAAMRPGTYLIETGTYPSIQGPMGLYGVLVVTTAPVTGATAGTTAAPGVAYPGIQYDADAVQLLSEIDPVQNAAVAKAVTLPGFSETTVWSGLPGGCGNPATTNTGNCYPPAVNYAPVYYLVNGVSFDLTSPAASTQQLPTTATTGNVLIRFVNAGLHMHVPSLVGQPFTLIAEDSNVQPDVQLAVNKLLQPSPKIAGLKTQSEVFLAAGKVYDVMFNPGLVAPTTGSALPGTYTGAAYSVFDRQLSLSTNNRRDGGMQSFVQFGTAVAGAAGGVPVAAVTPTANPDTYTLAPNVKTFSANVLANDVGITGATLGTSPTKGTVVLNANGTFTYTPTPASGFIVSDSFTYIGTYGAAATPLATATTVTLTVGPAGKPPVAQADAYTSAVSSRLKVPAPGVLTNDADGSAPPYPLTASPVGGIAGQPIVAGNLTYTLNADGSIVASATSPGTYTFQYNAVNSQGTSSTVPALVTLTFPAGSNQANTGWVTVQDAQTQAPITDYRWVIERDDNLQWDPGVTVAPPAQTLATSFFHSYMPVIATGCTGPVSCGSGQTVIDTDPSHVAPNPVQTFGQHVAFGQESPSFPNEVALDNATRYYISILPGDAADAAAHGGGAPNANPVDLSQSGKVVTATCVGAGCTLPAPVDKGDTVTITSGTLGYAGSWVVTNATATTFQYIASASNLPAAPASAYLSAFNPATDCNNTGATPKGPGAGNCGHIVSGAPILPACKPVGTATTCTGTFPNVVVTAEPNPLVPAQLSIFVFEDNNPTNGTVDGVEENQGLGGFQIILNDIAAATGITIGQMTYDMFNMPLTNALNNRLDTVTNPVTKTKLNQCHLAPETLIGMVVTCPRYLYDDAKQQFTNTVSPLAGHALIKNLFPNRFDVLAKAGAALEAAGEHWIQTSTLEGTHGNDAFAKVGEPTYFQEFGAPGFHSVIGFVNPAHINDVNAAQKGTKYSIDGTVTNLHMSRPSDESLHDSGSHEALSQSVCYVGLNSQNGIGANVAFAQCDKDGKFVLTGVPTGQYQLVIWDEWQDQILQYQTVNVANANVHFGDAPVLSWFQSVATRVYFDNGTDNPGIVQAPVSVRFRDGQFAASQLTDANGNAYFKELFPLFNWYVMESDTTRFKGSKVGIINDAGGTVDPLGTIVGKGQGFSQDYLTGGVLNSTESFSLPSNLQVPGATYYAGKTYRQDPGTVTTEGFQAFISEPQVIEWGKTPFAAGENGGITGHVVYASTRPYDDPIQNSQNLWDPLVPRVTVNLYQEGIAADGTMSLALIDSTTTTSWDDWAAGTRATGVPNMNCPGQDPKDQYMATIGAANQYKCYDGFHDWNQVQPAPFDGSYAFPTAAWKTAHNNATVLPAGKYVTEVIVPPGYQIVKEEDKNILTGDTYIAPVAQQFGAMSNIFIVPDQASIDAFNANNTSNSTTNLGRTNTGGFIAGGIIVQANPCVGQLRVVPDFLSIFPQTGLVAPFAGASRRTCERKEVTLEDQMTAKADFFIFTPTPKAAKFTGIILDDLSAEYNTTRPDFGEKFAVPFVPVSFRDFNGIEVSRMYADQYGTFNGLVYSTWEVNPPNPTGYAPNMMITCMNDPGPIVDTRPGSSTLGQLIQDPNYNPQYSNFCYTKSFMPGSTDYLDTPVLPTAAFAAGYNPVDCGYPDTTPAIARADVANNGLVGPLGAGVGPFVPYTGGVMTIKALGDLTVPNNAYLGPNKLVNGVWVPTTGLEGQTTITRHYGFGTVPGTVTLAGQPLATTGTGWTDGSITVIVPETAKTGELVVTAANGKSTVDAITVTIGKFGEKTPTLVEPANAKTALLDGLAHPIQDAIDAANPGDMIMLDAGHYPELVIMYKPVRLQGVGAASVMLNAAKYPTQKLRDWRVRINALFGLDMQGNTLPGVPAADPLPGQEITGGIVLLEPSVLATEEGAGITVVSKNEKATACGTPTVSAGNFLCHRARIDGVSVTGGDSGGGIYVNGWAHNLEISNNRVYGNSGTYTGGVRIGQPYLEGQAGQINDTFYSYNANVHVHNNSITGNGTVEANNGNGGVGGGLSMNSGSDHYRVNHNWVCGNFSLGDGGGIGHLGLSDDGRINDNTVIFNQVFNQSGTTSGGGIVIEGETGTAAALSLGTGNVVVEANLIQGNHAKAGHGGGLRLQDVNGTDIAASPNSPNEWYNVRVVNNMISNNVAGWAGGGISLSNTVRSNILNNTIVSNDSTATAGPVIALNAQGGAASTSSTKQPAGISSEIHSNSLFQAIGSKAPAALKKRFSNPNLENNIIWSNRSFNFAVIGGGTGANPGTPALSTLQPVLAQQTVAGECMRGAFYWDLGILGDTTPSTAGRANNLNPTYSILTAVDGNHWYPGNHNNEDIIGLVGRPGGHPTDQILTSVYCNGGRADPGIPDSTPPNPAFAFQVAGTEDEGGNWVDVRYGPLSLSDPSKYTVPGVLATPLSNLRIVDGAAKDTGNNVGAPHLDFFDTVRPQNHVVDIGAHELIQN
jgi:hypothetical protein